MHLADQATPQELRLKGSPGGKNYIGPAGPTPGEQDREIVSFDGRVLITRFIDKDAADPLRQHGLRALRAAGVRRTHPLPSCSAKAGHPVRRGLSAESLTSLEYWIAPPLADDDSGVRLTKQKNAGIPPAF